MSFTFHPEFVRQRIPGQVPRLDADIDRTLEMPPRFTIADAVERGDPARPILRASAVAGDLGLPAHAVNSVTGLIKTLSGSSTHELDFRRSVMTHLIEQRFEPALRRAILSRALSYFRSSRPSTSAVLPTLVVRPRTRLPNARPPDRLSPEDKAEATAERNDAEAEKSETEKSQTEKSEARGGKYYRRVPIKKRGKTVGYKYVYDDAAYRRLPDAHVDGQTAQREHLTAAVRRVLDKAGDEGCEVEHLRGLVSKHGSKSIAEILRAFGARLENGRVVLTHGTRGNSVVKSHISLYKAAFGVEYEEALWKAAAFGLLPLASCSLDSRFDELEKAEGEQLPEAKSPSAGTGAPSPKKLPPGTRRIWHNRIVERGVDDKWHVVGHVAGLEDPGKVPMLEPHEIDPEHLKDLIAKLKALISHEKKKHDLIHAPMPGPKTDAKTGAAGAKTGGTKPTTKPVAKPTAKSVTHEQETDARKKAADLGVARRPRLEIRR